MRYLADFDELHVMAENMLLEYSEEEIVENILNILKSGYIRGLKKAAEELDWEWEDYLLFGDDEEEWEKKIIFKDIKGKTVIDRIKEHVQALSAEMLAVVIDTEYHRDYNAGKFAMAEMVDTLLETQTYGDVLGVTKVKKRWVTMGDERVRSTHDFLDYAEVGINERFVTYDGDSALYPGDFELAENNINCRCYLEYTR